MLHIRLRYLGWKWVTQASAEMKVEVDCRQGLVTLSLTWWKTGSPATLSMTPPGNRDPFLCKGGRGHRTTYFWQPCLYLSLPPESLLSSWFLLLLQGSRESAFTFTFTFQQLIVCGENYFCCRGKRECCAECDFSCFLPVLVRFFDLMSLSWWDSLIWCHCLGEILCQIIWCHLMVRFFVRSFFGDQKFFSFVDRSSWVAQPSYNFKCCWLAVMSKLILQKKSHLWGGNLFLIEKYCIDFFAGSSGCCCWCPAPPTHMEKQQTEENCWGELTHSLEAVGEPPLWNPHTLQTKSIKQIMMREANWSWVF